MRLLNVILLCLLALPAAANDGWDSLYAQIERSITPPSFPDNTYVITDYGARTDATADVNQRAINKAIAACSAAGGGRVVVPEGTYRTGAVNLLSNVNLVVQDSATLLFAFEPDLYPIVRTRWEGLDCWNISPCIYAYRQKNIAITGNGTIDGGGTNETWWKWCGSKSYGWTEGTVSQSGGSRARLLQMAEDGTDMDERRFGPNDGLRPQLINTYECEDVLIENVTLLRSPFWVIHPLLSKNITVRGVHINNDGPNGDGCDPESCDGVLIENCFFNTGDDCIAIKSGRNNDGRLWDKPSENIIIRGCRMENGHGGVVIGSEISGGCRNVFAEDNVMDSPHLERVVRIKTNTCRGGLIENIYVRNTTVGQCAEAVLKINLDYEHNEICCRGYIPTVRNVYLDSVTCGKSKYGVQIIALDTCTSVYDIHVTDCRFDGVAEGNSVRGLTRDIVFDNLYINGSITLDTPPYEHYSEWMTASEMKRVPLPYMLDFAKKPKWSYVMGIELEAMLDTYLKYGNENIRDYCQLYTDTMISDKGEIRGYNIKDYNLDQIRTGHFVARMYELYPEKKNLTAIKTLMKQLKDQPRTNEGVFWHKAVYAYQVWLDGIFMGLPYYALTARMLLTDKKATAIYDDAVEQITKTYERTLDSITGLNRHAWDETREMFWADKTTGLSQHCWGRAQGWYTMALIELLDALPDDYARRGEVIRLLTKDLDAVIRWQDKATGVWFQVMDSPEREGNYREATCSTMFAYALLKAYRKGYVGEKYRDAGIRAYRGIVNNFLRVNADSTLSLTGCCAVAGLGPGVSDAVKRAAPKVKENRRRDGSYSYYLSEEVRDNDAKGIGPFIWASLEMEALGYNTTNITQTIDRQAVVTRHNPIITAPDSLNALSVGNGHFAATVDVTGLQSYPEDYATGIPLNTMSDFAWHTFPNTDNLTPEETQRTLDFGRGHDEVYAVEYKDAGRAKSATDYFRANPHRLNLGTVGLDLTDSNGNSIPLADLTNIRQELALYDGVIRSTFTADGENVEVMTACAADGNALIARIKSTLLAKNQAAVKITFSYPTGKHSDDANDYSAPERHSSIITASGDRYATIERTLDDTRYYVTVQWEGDAALAQTDTHSFRLNAMDNVLTLRVEYTEERPGFIAEEEQHAPAALTASSPLPSGNLQAGLHSSHLPAAFTFDKALKAVLKHWASFWASGAVVDFAQCTDPRAYELERRVVLSQYLTAVNCANSMPPQETGLTYNTWFGRPHLEMTWWHAVHFALWNRPDIVATMLDWYVDVALPKAQEIARRQGFDGARWMKMTDPDAGEAPSNVGSFLTWQQPHFIYLAEEMYRAHPSQETLRRYAYGVEQTALFMADFAQQCAGDGETIKLSGQTAMQESMSKDFSYCHPFEQAYWRYGLLTAQAWRERQGLTRNTDWDDIIQRMAPLTANDSIYVSGEPLMPFDTNAETQTFDPYASAAQTYGKTITEEDFTLKARSDHPAVTGACGMLPDVGAYDPDTMRATLNFVLNNWNYDTTWGWDYGMIAMCAARLGDRQNAVNALLMDKGKNTYLVNGHNYQEPKRLRLYLPGNGSLLAAVAMMCAGWDGCDDVCSPGFPKDGSWNVRSEGLHRMQ